jgi:hypothetical protein
MNIPRERSCPFLASRWDRESRGTTAEEENACYLWEESGVPPDVLQYGGVGRWQGEPYVPIPVEMQYSICTQPHYGTCRWLREQQWHTRETKLVCPLLGSKADRHHKYFYPTNHNVCHGDVTVDSKPAAWPAKLVARVQRCWAAVTRAGRGSPVVLESQRSMCLTERFSSCPRYRESRRV